MSAGTWENGAFRSPLDNGSKLINKLRVRVRVMNPTCAYAKRVRQPRATFVVFPPAIASSVGFHAELSRLGATGSVPRGNQQCILVTHEMGFAREAADHVYFTDKGVIVEHAPPAEFFTSANDPRTKEFLLKVL